MVARGCLPHAVRHLGARHCHCMHAHALQEEEEGGTLQHDSHALVGACFNTK